MLNAAVIRLRVKRTLSCRFVFGLIFTFHSRNSGIKAVAISHTHESAGSDQQQQSAALTDAVYRKWPLTGIDLIGNDQKVLGKAL